MNKTYKKITLAGLLVCCALTFSTSSAHEPPDLLHTIRVEIIPSSLGIPTGVHIKTSDHEIEVKGVLERRVGHRKKSLRGQVVIELLDAKGGVLDVKYLTIKSRSAGPARHDHTREFSAVFIPTEKKVFSIRVQHNVIGDI